MNEQSDEIQEDDFFFLTFIGEYVEVTTKIIASAPEQNVNIPLTIRGFLLDQDENFYYLGEGPGNIKHAVDKELVGIFTIIAAKSEFEEILDNFEPSKEEDIN